MENFEVNWLDNKDEKQLQQMKAFYINMMSIHEKEMKNIPVIIEYIEKMLKKLKK